jgi:hypothetical protein
MVWATRILSQVLWMTCLLFVCVSCTHQSDRLPVEGDVTFDGKSIDKGSIMFVPLDGKSIKTGGPIADGRFNIPAQTGPIPGKHRVLCFWEKDTGKTRIDRDSGDAYPVRQEGLPAIYQSDKSPLEVDFSSSRTKYDFHLKSP